MRILYIDIDTLPSGLSRAIHAAGPARHNFSQSPQNHFYTTRRQPGG